MLSDLRIFQNYSLKINCGVKLYKWLNAMLSIIISAGLKPVPYSNIGIACPIWGVAAIWHFGCIKVIFTIFK
jgi:hypothetical protein